jgi:leader peptidase (prepilin peptidase)/N-methyltransferase
MSFGLAVALGAVFGAIQIFARNIAEKKSAASNEADGEVEEHYEPESIGSLLKSGLGYVLCIDILGLFVPKWYEKWFGESAYESIEEVEDYPIEMTMIPFGPYLAAGAIVAVVFNAQLLSLVDAYMKWAGLSMIGLEHMRL